MKRYPEQYYRPFRSARKHTFMTDRSLTSYMKWEERTSKPENLNYFDMRILYSGLIKEMFR